jgi:hypothetical protein
MSKKAEQRTRDPKGNQDLKKRDFLKKAAYSAPAILSLQATSALAKSGSSKSPASAKQPNPKKPNPKKQSTTKRRKRG